MPIRINLLAEAQALEELRRRDPVKRAIWIGVLCVVIVLVWSSSLYLKGVFARSDLAGVENLASARAKQYAGVSANKRELDDITQKLNALEQLATNRFLNGTVLNALQQCTIDDVQLTRFRAEQRYELNEATKTRRASITEHVVLTLEARDRSARAGDQISRYKQSIASNPYFIAAMGRTNEVRLTSYQTEQLGPDGKVYVPFTLECRYPDKTR
jgi:hypothetical protein